MKKLSLGVLPLIAICTMFPRVASSQDLFENQPTGDQKAAMQKQMEEARESIF